jgi:hypothetical protein
MFESSLTSSPRCPKCRAEEPVALRSRAMGVLAAVALAGVGAAAAGLGILAAAVIVFGGVAAGIVNGRSMKWRCAACGALWR